MLIPGSLCFWTAINNLPRHNRLLPFGAWASYEGSCLKLRCTMNRLMELAHTICLMHGVYVLTVIQYGQMTLKIPDSLRAAFFFSGAIGAIAQVNRSTPSCRTGTELLLSRDFSQLGLPSVLISLTSPLSAGFWQFFGSWPTWRWLHCPLKCINSRCPGFWSPDWRSKRRWICWLLRLCAFTSWKVEVILCTKGKWYISSRMISRWTSSRTIRVLDRLIAMTIREWCWLYAKRAQCLILERSATGLLTSIIAITVLVCVSNTMIMSLWVHIIWCIA